MTAKNTSWLRRFRSSSFGSQLDVDKDGTTVQDGSTANGNAIAESAKSGKLRGGKTRGGLLWRKGSVNYIDFYVRVTPSERDAMISDAYDRLRTAPQAFPFQALNANIKLMIFSLLSPAECGRGAMVCREWSTLMRTPGLWSDVDLISFPPYPTDTPSLSATTGGPTFDGDNVTETSLAAYEAYRRRAIKFMSYLVTVCPLLRHVRFAFDIADVRDGWLDVLQMLFRASQCTELDYAELNWNETPAKPYVPENSSVTWCTNDYKDLMYRHRQRQRYFVKFFDSFTASAVAVTTLILPFDWTERSLRALNRLPNLEVLVLKKYFVFQSLEQTLLDTLFRSAPFLRRLTMEVWTPSGRGLQLFSMCSETLEMLDVSACRGFYLESVELPRLRVFKVSICPMNGPLISSDGLNIACLHDTLRNGAPNLVQINEHRLSTATWRDEHACETDETLDTLFKSIY